MNRRESYVRLLEEQLGEWAGEIDRLRDRCRELDGSLKVEHLQIIDQLRAQQEIVRHKLCGLRKADDDAWRHLKPGVDSAWRHLGNAIKSADSGTNPTPANLTLAGRQTES